MELENGNGCLQKKAYYCPWDCNIRQGLTWFKK